VIVSDRVVAHGRFLVMSHTLGNRCRDAMGPKAPDADRGGPTHGVPPPLSWKGEARAPAPDLACSHCKFLEISMVIYLYVNSIETMYPTMIPKCSIGHDK